MLRRVFEFLSLALIVMISVSTVSASEVERMTKEELLDSMNNEDIVIADVRRGADWKSSEFKIQGAVRVEDNIVEWAADYPKDTKIVLYCA